MYLHRGVRSASIFFLLLFYASLAYPSTDVVQDSVVQIFSSAAGKEKASLGTGVFIAPEGDILTCYHVIKGADRIEIFYQGRKFWDVTVISYSSLYDLAKLRINSPSLIHASLPLKDELPRMMDRQLDSFAFPAMATGEHLTISPSNFDKFISSFDLTDKVTSGRLFKKNFDLIAFNSNIYSGISGAPIVSHGAVIGVIEGSYSEGGSYAWAIPVKYAAALVDVNKTPGRIVWPPLEFLADPLRTDSFNGLRREASLTIPLLVALRQYSHTLDDLNNMCSSEVEKVPGLRAVLVSHSQDAELAIKNFGPDVIVLGNHDLTAKFVDQNIYETLMGFKTCSDLYIKIRDDGGQLKSEVLEYSKLILRTPHTTTLLETTNSKVNKIEVLAQKLDSVNTNWSDYVLTPWSSIADYKTAFDKGIAVIDRTNPKTTVQNLIDAFSGYNEIVDKLMPEAKRSH